MQGRRNVTDGAALIAAERQRQIEQEGWTPEHDDTHALGALADAALSYAEAGAEQLREVRHTGYPTAAKHLWTRTDWPWDASWWKPSEEPIRNLVKAGALIAAEIDRLLRQGAR